MNKSLLSPPLLGLVACCVLSLASRAPAAEEDWPAFLGPHGDNTSAETGLLKAWPAEGPPLVWKKTIGESYSAPSIAKGRLVVFYRLKNEEIVECVKATTGEGLWKFTYPTQYEDRYGYNNGPRCAPAIDGNRVFTYGAEGKLTCLDFEKGTQVWQRFINEEYKVPQGFFGAGGAPVVEGDRILVNLGAPNGGGIAAFDKATGKTLWTATSDGASYSTPRVAAINGKRLGLFFTQAGFVGVDVSNGEVKYDYPFRSKTYESVNAASPVVVGDEVFLSATYGTGAVLLKLAPEGLKEIWKNVNAMQNHWATSIYRDGVLYGMDGRHENGSNFRCIDFKTGEIKWTADRGLGRAAFIWAEGNLIALGERGDLALIEANPREYKEKSTVRLLSYPCWTPPVLSHGLLYIRSQTVLLCLDLKEKK